MGSSAINMSTHPSTKIPKFTRKPDHRSCSLQQVALPKKMSSLSLASNTTPTTLSNSRKTDCNTKSLTLNLSHLWRELQGSTNWENLVQPLHPLLRQEVIRYGEFVTACYKAFDLDPNSKRYLTCKYGKKSLLQEVGLGDSCYEITKYIYATPDITIPTQNVKNNCGRWIGYVAVSSDAESKRIGRRDILVTFRGTVTNSEWIANLMSSLTPARFDPDNPRPDVKVELGFLSLYTSDESSSSKFGLESCREQLLSEVTRIINKYKSEEMSITIAGHSMGSSLGLLLAYDIAELGLNKNGLNRLIPITVFSFAGPRVGNSGFKERCDELGVKVLRIVNVNDPITKLPGVLFNENFRVSFGGKFEYPWSCSCYAHVGVELALDFFKMHNPSCVHDLESYISLLRFPKIPVKLKCDEKEDDQEQGFGFLSRAREIFLNAQSFDFSPWRDAACTMVHLVQSQSQRT